MNLYRNSKHFQSWIFKRDPSEIHGLELTQQQGNTETTAGSHRAGTGVGDLARVGGPLVVVSVFVREGAVEDVPDVGHGVHAHR